MPTWPSATTSPSIKLPEDAGQREGLDYQVYRSELRNQIAIEQLRQRDVLSRISVTPKEVDEYLARQAGRAAFNLEYNLSQILVAVSPTATPDTIAAAEKKIDGDP